MRCSKGSGGMITDFIWDFDGMLFDTYPHTTAAICEHLRRHGRSFDPEEVFRVLKISIRDAFRAFGINEKEEAEFYAIEHDLDFEPCAFPYEGISELLHYIVEHGGRNYLYTHRDRYAVIYLEKYGLDGLFTDFVTREMHFPLKPSPDAINYIIEKHGLDKDCCLMLGDRAIDCGSGLNAGVKALLFDEFSCLEDTDYTYYTTSIAEVYEKIKELMK